MAEKKENELIVNTGQAVDVVEDNVKRLLEVADVDKVYGKPVQQGDITIIPAGEVVAVAGFGVGLGSGVEGEAGGGGGGGGRTFTRPVAVVVVSPNGVRVEPVIDTTKIALAALTAGGFMLTTLLRMMRGNDGSEE